MARTQALMIQIATGDPRPIGRQIVDAVRMKIATAELEPGDQLPSVRGLAQQLTINPNTVAKAYAELVTEGWLESRQGLGLYVATPRQRLSESERERRLDDAIGRFLNDVIALDYPPGEVQARLEHEFRALAPRKLPARLDHTQNAHTELSRPTCPHQPIRRGNVALSKHYGRNARSTTSTCASRAAASTPSSARTRRQVDPVSGSCSASCRRPPASAHPRHDSQQLTPEIRGRIGFVNEEHTLPGWMRVSQVTAMQRHQYPRWNQHAFDSVIGHYHVLPEQKVGQLSRGERAGFNLALALAQAPELLVLDEPTLGLDVVAKRAFLESLLHGNAAEEVTVIYCSHQMEEIERVADNLIILERGRLETSPRRRISARGDALVADVPFRDPNRRAYRDCWNCSASTVATTCAGPGRGFRTLPARQRCAVGAQHAGEPGPRGQWFPGQEPCGADAARGRRLSAPYVKTTGISR